ncbi:MAG: VTT domain-containing protein [Bacteroidota bacterium]
MKVRDFADTCGMRLVWLFLGLAALVLIPFFIWGDSLMGIFSAGGAVNWLRTFGGWGWLAGIVLLLSDLLLPMPATLVMAALGFLYGWLIGGVLSAFGSLLAGALGYELCRGLGEDAARWLLGPKDFEKAQRINQRIGGWVVVLSRWLPVFPEVISCMAGLTQMPRKLFYAALACGSLPLGFTYAAIGHAGNANPTISLLTSVFLPPVLWLLIRPAFRKRIAAHQ